MNTSPKTDPAPPAIVGLAQAATYLIPAQRAALARDSAASARGEGLAARQRAFILKLE